MLFAYLLIFVLFGQVPMLWSVSLDSKYLFILIKITTISYVSIYSILVMKVFDLWWKVKKLFSSWHKPLVLNEGLLHLSKPSDLQNGFESNCGLWRWKRMRAFLAFGSANLRVGVNPLMFKWKDLEIYFFLLLKVQKFLL